MYRIFLTLALLPFASALAVTPFVSVGMAPTLTRFTYDGDQYYSHPYERNFISLGGAVNAGVQYGSHEWYARFTWSNSDETQLNVSTDTYIEDVVWSFERIEFRDSWKDRRLSIGHHWLFAQCEQKQIVVFGGIGGSVGSAKWTQREHHISDVIDFENFVTHYDTLEYSYKRSKFSSYSLGGFVDLGARVSLKHSLFLEASAQLSIDQTAFKAYQDFDLYDNHWGNILEPAIVGVLRWDICFPKSHN